MAAITAKEEQNKKGRVQKGVDAMKKPDKPEGTLREINVRPADNGFTVSTHRDKPQDKQKGKDGDAVSPMYQPPQDSVFSGDTAMDDALAHIKNHMMNKNC